MKIEDLAKVPPFYSKQVEVVINDDRVKFWIDRRSDQRYRLLISLHFPEEISEEDATRMAKDVCEFMDERESSYVHGYGIFDGKRKEFMLDPLGVNRL